MESERRPANEKTDLEVLMRVKAPEFFEKHGANIILGIILLAAIVFFFYQKRKTHQQEAYSTNVDTAIAYNYAIQLRDLMVPPGLSNDSGRDRQALANEAFSRADKVLTSDATPAQKASAQLAKAEVLWALAIMPPESLATSQPVSGFTPRTQQAYLEDARLAYFEILQKYPDQKEIAANALLSLAAICESGSKFDDAQDWYQKVLRDDTLRGVYHDIAKSRLAALDDLKKPFVLMSPATQPTSRPANAPSTAPATSQPTTQP